MRFHSPPNVSHPLILVALDRSFFKKYQACTTAAEVDAAQAEDEVVQEADAGPSGREVECKFEVVVDLVPDLGNERG